MELTDQWTAKYGAAYTYRGFFNAERLYISDPAAIVRPPSLALVITS
jgi:hypothetical protein